MSNAKNLRMRAFIQSHPLLVPKVLWVLIVLWYELGSFYHSASCTWPMVGGDASPKPAHVLVVADPQMLDENSYPGRPPWLMTLTQFIVDSFLRKAWRVAISKQPDTVVFLGDMLDNGRAEWDEAKYRAHVAKFRRMFKPPVGAPVYYLPGNHDVWLGGADERAQVARARFEGHFGPRNDFAVVGNHTLVFVDAPQLVEDDRARARERTGPGDVSGWIPPAIRELKQRVDRASPHNPVVLFSHIPLTRPDDADCGPLREKGTLRAGRGFGYENTLSEVVSGMLLDTFRPDIVFSGDDHDYCDITHTVAQSDNRAGSATGVHEVSVKSLSMAMGIRRPGFQLLSLASPAQPSFAHSPCLLPDQLGTYMYRYAPLFAMTFFGLLVVAARDSDRTRARSKRDEEVLLPSSWAGAKEYHAYAAGSRRNSGMIGLTGRIVRALERTTHGRIVLYFGIVAWPALLAFVLVHLWIL